MVARLVDEVGVFVAPVGGEPHLGLVHQHFGEADDDIERRAQLVTHGGNEAALGIVGAFSLGAGIFEALLLRLAISDVTHHGDDFA